jgi:hypothetical protein
VVVPPATRRIYWWGLSLKSCAWSFANNQDWFWKMQVRRLSILVKVPCSFYASTHPPHPSSPESRSAALFRETSENRPLLLTEPLGSISNSTSLIKCWSTGCRVGPRPIRTSAIFRCVINWSCRARITLIGNDCTLLNRTGRVG